MTTLFRWTPLTSAIVVDEPKAGDDCVSVTLGIAADGQKQVLALWHGSTEMPRRGMAPTTPQGLRLHTGWRFVVIPDGSPAFRKALHAPFGHAALVRRSEVREIRNALEEVRGPTADSRRRMENKGPGVGESVREGLDETRNVLTLNPSSRGAALADHDPRWRESLQSDAAREPQRQRRCGGQIVAVGAARMPEAVTGFRRLKG